MFKLIIAAACLGLFAFSSCSHDVQIVEQEYVDSLLENYDLPELAKAVENDALFWERRIELQPENFVAKKKYVHALISRFHLYADITDLKKADSLLVELKDLPPASTSEVLLTLANVKMLQHQFQPAAELIEQVQKSGEEPYAASMLKFDADFELGNTTGAKLALTASARKDFAFHFRFAKQEDQEGSMESAINEMKKASAATHSPTLKTVALSNAADFSMHSGKLYEAYELYKYCISINPADFHSLEMIGWLALVHDNNRVIAENIFNFLKERRKSPGILLQLSRIYELTDQQKAREYAIQFASAVSDPSYGDMYTKYLVEVYTGPLNQPAKAVIIARKEISNRATPQTYAWLARALMANGENDAGYKIYQRHISGHSLEGQESLWIGKLLMDQGKRKEAGKYLDDAKFNRYELTPAMANELASLTKAL